MINERILAHRGLWETDGEKNTTKAIRNALNLGFGVEIDIREFDQNLIMSHDLPSLTSEVINEQDSIWRLLNEDTSIAYNIKEDGLGSLLKNFLSQCPSHNGFAFDMSIPETLIYDNLDIDIAIRVSEIEPVYLNLLKNRKGPKRIWLDSFFSDWWVEDFELFKSLSEFQVFIVSPELHGRDPQKVWAQGKLLLEQNFDIFICTDFPKEVAKLWG